MMNIEIKINPSIHLLRELYDDEYIRRAAHDDRKFEPIINNQFVEYYSVYINDIFIGAFVVIKQSSVEFEIHSLLYKWAVQYSRDAGRAIIEKLFNENESLHRLTTYIIQGLESTVNYCKKLGFEIEGIRKQSCKVNGELRNIYMMGYIKKY